MGKLKDTIAEIRAREQEEGRMSLKEYISYGVSRFGFGTVGKMYEGYQMPFYASIGIPINIAGVMIAIIRFWDLFNDPAIATIIDTEKYGIKKRGKFTRWLSPMVPALTITAIVMFINPPGSLWVKVVWLMVLNIIWEAVSTFTGISFQSMQAVMSADLQERSSYLTFGNLGDKLVGALPGIIPIAFDFLVRGSETRTPLLRESSFYTLFAVVLCSIGGIAAMFSKNLKERVFSQKQDKHLWESLLTFLRNKQLLLLWTANLTNFISAAGWAAAPFFFKDAVGNFSVQTLVWTLTGTPTFLVMLLSPLFLKRFSPRKVVIFNKILNAACMFAMFFVCSAVGYASTAGIVFIILFNLIASIPSGVSDVANNVCTINTFDYTEWQTGDRAEATTFMISGMLNKGINGLGPLIAGVLMARAGFVSGEGVVLSQATKDSLFLFYTVFQGLGMLLSVIPYFFYKIEGPLLDQVQAELAERRKGVNSEAADEEFMQEERT